MATTSHFHEWDVRRGSPGQGLCLGLAAAGALRLVMGGCMQMVIKIEKGRGAGYSSACIAALSLYVCLSLPPLAPFLHKCKSLRIRQDLPVSITTSFHPTAKKAGAQVMAAHFAMSMPSFASIGRYGSVKQYDCR